MSLDPIDRRYAGQQAVAAVPKRLRQRQDSLEAQLHTLIEMATRAGCYDAADWIKTQLERKPTRGRSSPV